MTNRLKAMRRILAVQTQIERIAEVKLGATERRKGEIEAAQRDLDAFVGDLNGGGRLTSLALDQARRLGAREAATERDRLAQAEALRQAQSRLRLTERLVEGLARDHRRAEERQDLERLIEAYMARTADPP